jgi:hypothetical protein
MYKDIIEKESFIDDSMGDIQYAVILKVEQYPVKNAAQACRDEAGLLVKDYAR